VAVGHDAQNVQEAEVVVFSTAVGPDNPEIGAARAREVPVIRRAEMLAELMRMKFSIAISGSHGKTTTTSLVAHTLMRAGLDPTTVVGGRVLDGEAGARLGQSEYLVAEADESDRSFLVLYPALAVVTNIEPEHLDFYKDLGDLKREFIRFVNRVPFYGSVVLGIDSPAVKAIRHRVKRRVVTFALEGQADFTCRDVQLYGFTSAFTLVYGGRQVGRFSLPMAGRHNIQNALAAAAVATELGIDFGTVEQALATFAGIHRRLEKRGERGGILVYDDYGHHPTEIRVTLEALRGAHPQRRIVAVFQPHRYTRTRLLGPQFGESFDAADEVVVTRLYAASEPAIEGVDERVILAAIREKGRAGLVLHHVAEMDEVPAFLAGRLKPGDVVLTMGAGNIAALADRILEAL
jgi:UDP-N-acetylmuramate--alanine ligase